jgi:hypothetical protein
VSDSNERSNSKQGARLPDEAARNAADRMDNATISYGQTVAANEPEIAAGSNDVNAEQRMERAEGAGQPVFIPAKPGIGSSGDLESMRDMDRRNDRRPDEAPGNDQTTRRIAVDRDASARRGG